MYVLIEHSGTKYHNELAKKIGDYITEEFGYTPDYAISNNEASIALYDDSLKNIAEFANPNSDDELYYILRFLFTE